MSFVQLGMLLPPAKTNFILHYIKNKLIAKNLICINVFRDMLIISLHPLYLKSNFLRTNFQISFHSSLNGGNYVLAIL